MSQGICRCVSRGTDQARLRGQACYVLQRIAMGGRPRTSRIFASKGFGEPEQRPTGDQLPKLSKRGTVASRQGQKSNKEIKKMRTMIAEQKLQDAMEEEEEEAPFQEVPSSVSNRMLQRIILFSGIPVLIGFLLLPAFYYIKVVQGVDVPTYVVYLTQLVTFGGGLLGITYGVLSASWSPGRKGGLLGIEEFKANTQLLVDRIKKN